jgi:MarR family transcriptional regulator, temperature-dependent positive regulator of motility
MINTTVVRIDIIKEYIRSIDELIIQDEDLTLNQIEILSYLSQEENMTVTELACRMKVNPSYISRSIDPLINNGLIDREYSESDRRFVLLSLTESGDTESTRLLTKKNEVILRSQAALKPKDINILNTYLAQLGWH